jgi:hypothetical protein
MRWPTNALGLLAASALVGGCAYTDGEPWGHAEFAVTAALDVPASRLTDDGRWKTTTNQSLDVTAASVVVGSITLTQSSSTESAAFDPADPPDGYSLCHNGHCHRDDGVLVDYEDIALELGQTTAGASISVPIAQVADLLADPSPLPMEPCEEACDLGLGGFASASVSLDRISISARAFDDTDAERLPEDGLDVRIDLTGPLVLDVPLDGTVTRDSTVERRLDVAVGIPVQLLDGIDFGAVELTDGRLTDVGALSTIEANLNEHAVLDVSLTP